MFRPTVSHSLFNSVRGTARTSVRSYATAPPAKQSNVPLYLGVGGLAGLAGWLYLGGLEDPSAPGKAKESAASAVNSAKGAISSVALDPQNFKSFKLADIKPYNHDSARFIFDLPEGTTSGITVASAVLFKAADGLKDDNGKEVIRPYTPTSDPADKSQMEFLIKQYNGGAMSQHIHGLKVGDSIQIKGPLKKHQYEPNQYKEIGLLAGGTGVTPCMQVLRAIRSNPDDRTKVTFIFTNKSEKDILLREEFDELARDDDRFRVVYGLDKLPKDFKGPHQDQFEGYITSEILSKHMPAPAKADDIRIFLCGPPPFVESIAGNKVKGQQPENLKGLLADLGYQADQVYRF